MTFNITKSLQKARWVIPDTDLDQVAQITRHYDIPEIVARILVMREVEESEIQSFLYPTLKDNFPDPFSLVGMEEMAKDIAADIRDGQNFAIFGDFDVDGATSSAILHRYLKGCGIDAPITIPDRLTEGYGPNVEALQMIKDTGADILFILDCGTTAHKIIAAGTQMGLKIIILDHHEAEETLPNCAHLINPKRKDDTSDLDMLAACGVTFLACVAINNKLREAKFFDPNTGRSEPDMRQLLDLVALGTVCDMVPLLGPNRLFVKSGFKVINKKQNKGLDSLCQVSGLENEIVPYHAGFVLGPRINAGSRVHDSSLGAQLLSSEDDEECRNIAWKLNDCNDKRKAIQTQMEREAIAQVEAQGLENQPVIIVDHKDWHAGLSGLVAGRLKEKYKKPAVVVTYVENAQGILEGRGSGRSVAGIHIAQAFMDAREAGFLEKGGGHAMAGGFTVLPEKLEALKKFLSEHVVKQLDGEETQVNTEIEVILSTQGVNVKLVELLDKDLGPFGQEFSEPLFMLSNVKIWSADILGENHIKLLVSDSDAGGRLKCMAFRALGTEMGEAFIKQGKRCFHLVGHLKINEWQGRKSAEFHVRDAAFADEGES